MTDKPGIRLRLHRFARNNAVTLLFVALTIFCIALSGMRWTQLTNQLMSRFSRNAFIILALIIPVVAGMGINFAISIGAMAAQIAILLSLNWQVPGIWGFLLSCVLTIPMATLFGVGVGSLLNKMKGQEMIGSMILGFFANGLYQLLFLYIFGTLIPISNPDLTIVGASGVRNTLDLSLAYGFKGALDKLWLLPFQQGLYWGCGIWVAVSLLLHLLHRKSLKSLIRVGILAVAMVLLIQVDVIAAQFAMTKVPMVTIGVIALLCLFNTVILRTRLGQRFRAVGQNRAVANAAGIHVNRTRLIAIAISTVLAGIGQVIFMQNFGTLQTYSAHEQAGLYAGAAILVGGASIVRATNAQAILGCILFHALFIVAPSTGNTLFGNAAIGESFRVFVSYGVIALSLVLHGLRARKKTGGPLETANKAQAFGRNLREPGRQ